MNYAALHFPDLPLTCLLAREGIHSRKPAALLSQKAQKNSQLIAVNPAARHCQLWPGIPTTRALARCPELLLLDPDPLAEKSARAEILAFIDSLVPDFELTTPDTFLLDLSTLLIASETEWSTQTQDAASYLGLPLSIGLGPTPDLAHLTSLSPTKHPLTLSLRNLARANHQHFPLPQLSVLELWGLQTLGDLTQLPRQGLAERLGPDLARLHDILLAKRHRLLQPHRFEKKYQIQHDFEHPITGHAPLLFIAKRLLQTLCRRLAQQQQAAAGLHLTLAFENGAAHTQKLMLSEPTFSAETLLRSLHTHLDSLSIPAPTEQFHLQLIPTLPHHAQHQLFSRGLKDPNQFSDTLRRLSDLVGPQRLGTPHQSDSHQPDSFQLTPVLSSDFKTPSVPQFTPSAYLPLKRQRPPLPINVASEKQARYPRPLALLSGPHQGPIQTTRGPFPLSGSWWQETWQQAQWDIELPDALLLQLTYTPPENWFLTGIYA